MDNLHLKSYLMEQPMKLLLNDKEIAHFLLSLIDYKEKCSDVQISHRERGIVIEYILTEKAKKKFDLNKMRKKFKDKIRRAVERDVRNYMNAVKTQLENVRKSNFNTVHKKLDHFINLLGEENILNYYKNHQKQNFVKSVGYSLDTNAAMMRRTKFVDYTDDCLIRNTVGNEELLISKIDNNYPFWFIDSGYTNFLEPNKKFHRLVRNHLHHGDFFEAPVDRLGVFKTFPQQWRTGGEKILVIEPGPFAAGIFHVDLRTWKYKVEEELRKYTDKPIVFREKAPKKTRTRLYKELCNEDYYCVVNINSNAATEAVWAGIPVITLDKHITRPVARHNLSDINDLIRPNLAPWLCMLSYSQFTFDELINGTAAKIIKKYHG